MRPYILLFGDSLTQQGFGNPVPGVAGTRFGWASLLSSSYARRADVLNRGFNGYNTRHALGVLPTSVFPVLKTTTRDLLFCTVFLGANDAALPGTRQHVPPDEYERNLRSVVSGVRRAYADATSSSSSSSSGETVRPPLPPIVLMTPPPVHATKWNEFCVASGRRSFARTNEASRSYGERVIGIGRDLSLPVLDVFRLLKGDQGEDAFSPYLTDGVHLTEEGQELIHSGLMSLVANELPHLIPAPGKDYNEDATSYHEKVVGVKPQEKDFTELC